MTRRDDPGEALARAYHATLTGQPFPAKGCRTCRRATADGLRSLAAEGWRLTREPELTVERLARAVDKVGDFRGYAFTWTDAEKRAFAAAILAALERDDDAG